MLDERLGAEQDQLPCGSTEISSGNCEEQETCMVRTCITPLQTLQNHHSRYLGECWWVPTLSAKEILHGQHQRVAIPAHARTAHKGLLQKRLEDDLCWIVPRVLPTTQSATDWTELNWSLCLVETKEILISAQCVRGTQLLGFDMVCWAQYVGSSSVLIARIAYIILGNKKKSLHGLKKAQVGNTSVAALFFLCAETLKL